jgi:hypothetical protein
MSQTYTPLTTKELDALQQFVDIRQKHVTLPVSYDISSIWSADGAPLGSVDDAPLFCAAVNALPSLLAEVRDLRQRIDAGSELALHFDRIADDHRQGNCHHPDDRAEFRTTRTWAMDAARQIRRVLGLPAVEVKL